MKQYLIGIDSGNTSSKVVIFEKDGTIVSTASTKSMKFEKRAAAFEEFDLDELWSLIADCIKEAIDKAGIDPKDIKGIGVTSFGNGVTFVGKNGESIAPGCFSQDYRANEIVAMYEKEGKIDRINDIIKGTLYAGEPAPILRWYKEHERDVYDKIGGIMCFKDYIMFRLTGVVATDLNVFGGSAMLDMSKMEYSRELMELFGIEELYDALPKLANEPTEIVGTVTEEAAAITGLAAGTPVAAGMMDILACLVGAGATGEGVYTSVAGSWCINETHSKDIIPNASANMPYIYKGEYLNCSFTGASGTNYEWFTQALGGEAKRMADEKGVSYYQILDELIASVDPAKTNIVFSPFVAQPSIHPNAKANFFNIDQNTSYAEIVYALAEGVAFIHKYHIDFLKASGLPLKSIRFTGGTSKSDVWNKVFANVLKTPIIGVDCDETGALGAAIAAGIGAGVYKDYEEAFSLAVNVKDPVYPDESTYEILDQKYAQWSRLNELMKTYWDEQA